MSDFEQLLREVLAEETGVESRPGMEGRVLARVAAEGKGRVLRWWGAVVVMTGAAVGLWLGFGVRVPRGSGGGGAPVPSVALAERPEVRGATVDRVRGGKGPGRRRRREVEDLRGRTSGGVAVAPLEVAPLVVSPLVVDGVDGMGMER